MRGRSTAGTESGEEDAGESTADTDVERDGEPLIHAHGRKSAGGESGVGFEAVNASRAAERVKDSGEAHQSVSTTPESVMLASRVMSASRWIFAVAVMIRSN